MTINSLNRFFKNIGKTKVRKLIIFLLIVGTSISSLYTYQVITNTNHPISPDPKSALNTILINLLFLLALATFITTEIFRIWANKRKAISSYRIQAKIILIFSLVASIPTVLITLYSVYFFNHGIESWFNQRINTAFKESVSVAQAYLKEHERTIDTDIRGIAYNINYLQEILTVGSDSFNDYLTKVSDDRNFIEAIVFKAKPFQIIAKSKFTLPPIQDQHLNKALAAAEDKVVILRDESLGKVQALIKLENFSNEAYLLIGRLIDAKVIEHVNKTQNAYNEYEVLNSDTSKMQIQFYAGFVIFSILLVLSAIWVGIIISSSIIRPLSILIKATEKIKDGNFSIKIEEGTKDDEISSLAKAFNLMTEQLDLQRAKLLEANIQIDARRHFSETVISNVSAGVIALNIDKKITMINPQAKNILSLIGNNLIGNSLVELFSEIEPIILQIDPTSDKPINSQLNICRSNKNIILLIRITNEILDKKTHGFVITFDDISELVLAQRSAAWSDVARRIAHEIKNPLTPIHLASQRLQKKYAKEVSDDKTFTKYTETIIKHVNQIGRMVEEFVYFARMPSPKFTINSLNTIIEDAIFSRKCLENDIKYNSNLCNDMNIHISCDAEQILQSLTNLLKNAEESLLHSKETRLSKKINISTLGYEQYIILTIEDNGDGFPPQLLNRLTEPYVTNKSSGTGLGLAIVKKILDDHSATIEFTNLQAGGAKVEIIFPILNKQKKEEHFDYK